MTFEETKAALMANSDPLTYFPTVHDTPHEIISKLGEDDPFMKHHGMITTHVVEYKKYMASVGHYDTDPTHG